MSQCEFHGYEKDFCPGCRADTKREIKEKIKSGTHAYIISAWHGDGNYTFGNAIGAKFYKSRAVAERSCTKGNEESGFERVVRLVAIPKAGAA